MNWNCWKSILLSQCSRLGGTSPRQQPNNCTTEKSSKEGDLFIQNYEWSSTDLSYISLLYLRSKPPTLTYSSPTCLGREYEYLGDQSRSITRPQVILQAAEERRSSGVGYLVELETRLKEKETTLACISDPILPPDFFYSVL